MDLQLPETPDVRLGDPDRWSATRFILDPDLRNDVVAIYAFALELRRAAERPSEALVAEIRLAWWRDALEARLDGGEARGGHPALDAMVRAVKRRALPTAPLFALIEAWSSEASGEAPADPAGLEARIDALFIPPMALALAALGAPGAEAGLADVARAWGLARMAGDLPSALRPEISATRERIAGWIRASRPAVRNLPVSAFPAIAYATLAPVYASGRSPTDLERRARLTWAVLTGRL